MGFFRIVRWPNLLIVGLTQYLICYRILRPAFFQTGIQPVFDDLHFNLLVAVTVLITASGYIINDLLDYPVDRIYKPERVVLPRRLSFTLAYWWCFLFFLAGFSTASYLAFYADRLEWLYLFPLSAAGLYWYSATGKRYALIGNILVSLFCAGVAGILWLAELPALEQLKLQAPEEFSRVWSVFSGYLVFAFLSNLFREVVKDLEDREGDGSAGLKTAPVLWGENIARWIAISLGVFLGIFLVWEGRLLQHYLRPGAFPLAVGGVLLPLIVSFYLLAKAKRPKDYHRISLLAKGIMGGGLLLLWFV